MAGKRHFQTAAKGQAVQRDRHRLAARLQLTQCLVEREAALELCLLQLCLGHVRSAFAAARAFIHLAQIRPCAEAAGFARRQDQALDGIVGGNFLGDGDDVGDGFRCQRVHAAARHVECRVRDAVAVDVPTECFEFHIVYSVRLYLD